MNLKQRIIYVNTKSDRLIAVKLAFDKQPLFNIVSYAQQTGYPDQGKPEFWDYFDDLHKSIISPGDWRNIEIEEYEIMGQFGYGIINKEDDEQILNFCVRHSLFIFNAYFDKKAEFLITILAEINNHR